MLTVCDEPADGKEGPPPMATQKPSVSVNTRGHPPSPPLLGYLLRFYAANGDDNKVAQWLQWSGCSADAVNARDSTGETPISLAVMHGHALVVDLISDSPHFVDDMDSIIDQAGDFYLDPGNAGGNEVEAAPPGDSVGKTAPAGGSEVETEHGCGGKGNALDDTATAIHEL